MAVGVPRYIQLAEVLRQRIRDGQYPAGSRLPTEVDLVEETGYSRDTVRAAVRLLRESGWVTVTHRLGTFINPHEDRKTP